MKTSTESASAAASLMLEAAEFYRKVGTQNPPLTAQLVAKADALTRASHDLLAVASGGQDTAKPADAGTAHEPAVSPASVAAPSQSDSPRRDGVWARRSAWLGEPDVPPGQWLPFDASLQDHVTWKTALDDTFRQHGTAMPDDSAIAFSFPAFLPGVTLAHLTRPGTPGWDAIFNITRHKGGPFIARSFDFMSPEVHRLNFETPLDSLGHELEYLRYFMHAVHGPDGPFRLLEGLALARARPHLQTVELPGGRGRLLDAITPPRFFRIAGDGGIVYATWILYAGAIFRAQLAIYPDGRVDMLEDEPEATPLTALNE